MTSQVRKDAAAAVRRCAGLLNKLERESSPDSKEWRALAHTVHMGIEEKGMDAYAQRVLDLCARLEARKAPCDHDWPEADGQTDVNGFCTKCGMSFQRYIHTECP